MNKIDELSDEEKVNLFNTTESKPEKLKIFSSITDDNIKISILNQLSESEKYRYIGRLKSEQNIAMALNGLDSIERKIKTFSYVAKQFKGNNIGLLRILASIDFNVTIPQNLLTFQLNNLNGINLDFLINIQRHVENYLDIKFKINEYGNDSKHIEYSFSEFSAIIAKIEELTAGIPSDMDEANRFYTVYSREVSSMTYDYECIRKTDALDAKFEGGQIDYFNYREEKRQARREAAGLYGGLVEGKSICAGYALILNEALKSVGIKSQYVEGYPEKGYGHAWNQVQIDGKWYNVDPTWDSECFQRTGRYKYMLLNDEKFEKSHGKFSERRNKTYRKCKSKFDYSKIHGLLPRQIDRKDASRI